MVKSQQKGIELVTRPADLQKLEADRAKDKKRVDKLLTAFNDSDEEVTAEETEKKNEASGSVAAIKPFSLAPQAESKDPSSEEKKAATPGFSFGTPKSDPKPKSTESADPKGPDVTANTGSKDEKKDDKPPPPAFSFGASVLASSASTAKPEDKKEDEGTAVASKPQFSFGTSAVSPKPKDPLSSAAAATTSIPGKPSFAFGSSGGSTTSRSGH